MNDNDRCNDTSRLTARGAGGPSSKRAGSGPIRQVAGAAVLVVIAGLLLGFFWWGYWLGDYNLFQYQHEYEWDVPRDLFLDVGPARMLFELKLWLYLLAGVVLLGCDWLLVGALRTRWPGHFWQAGRSSTVGRSPAKARRGVETSCAWLRGAPLANALVEDARAFIPFLGLVYFLLVVCSAREPTLASLFIFIFALAWHLALQCLTLASAARKPVPLETTGAAAEARLSSSDKPGGHRWGMALVLALSLVTFATFAWMNLRGYQGLRLGYKDSGMFATILYNTLHGRLFFADSIAVVSKHYLGRHFSPGLLLLVPVFWLFPWHETLLVLHALFLTMASIPVYLTARRVSGSTFVGAMLACGYLVAAPLSHTNWGNSYGFQPYSMVVLVVAWTLWALVARRWGWLALCVVLGLLLEEQYALILVGLGAWLAVGACGVARRRDWRLAAVLVALGLVWFSFAVFSWMPWFGGGRVAERYYDYLGDTPLKMAAALPRALLQALADWNRWEYLVHLLLPVGFLALAAPRMLLVGAPLFLVIILAGNPAKYSIILGHQGTLLPVIAMAAAAGARRLTRSRWLRRAFALQTKTPSPEAMVAGLGVMVVAAAAGSGYFFAMSPLSRVYPRKTFEVSYRDGLLQQVTQLVSPDASVCATFRAASHFAVRQHLYLYPLDFDQTGYPANLGDPDYVLLDFAENWTHPGAVLPGRDALWKDPGRRLLYAEEGFLLYGRGENNSEEVLRRLVPAEARPRRPLNQDCGYGVVLVGTDSAIDPGRPNVLRVTYYWRATRPLDRQLFARVSVGQGGGTQRQFYHLLANGMVPPAELPVGQVFAQTNALELPEDVTRVPANVMVRGLAPVPAVSELTDAVKAGPRGPASSPRGQPARRGRAW